MTGAKGQRRVKQMLEILNKIKKGSQTTTEHWTACEWLNKATLLSIEIDYEQMTEKKSCQLNFIKTCANNEK
eukprot:7011927-Lingulodinium_polyedra.AAC.1